MGYLCGRMGGICSGRGNGWFLVDFRFLWNIWLRVCGGLFLGCGEIKVWNGVGFLGGLGDGRGSFVRFVGLGSLGRKKLSC